jgi:hypothetical protein
MPAIVYFLDHSSETLSAVTGPKRDEIFVGIESQAVVGKCVAERNLPNLPPGLSDRARRAGLLE